MAKTKAVKAPKAPKEPKAPQPFVCKLCKEKTADFVMYKGFRYHPECMRKKEQLEIDQIEWVELCEYVSPQIFGYTGGKEKFPKYLILRLRGLREGKFFGNRITAIEADYSFKAILYTFKAKKLDILSVCSKIEFKDETHRINTIMRIVEDNINDTLRRLKKVADSNNKLDNMKIDDLQLEELTPVQSIEKEEPKVSKMAEKFKDLW